MVAHVVLVEVSHISVCLRSTDSFVRACSVTVLVSAHDCTLAMAGGETPYWNFGISWVAQTQRRCCRSPGSRGASRCPSGSCRGPCGGYIQVSVLNFNKAFPLRARFDLLLP